MYAPAAVAPAISMPTDSTALPHIVILSVALGSILSAGKHAKESLIKPSIQKS